MIKRTLYQFPLSHYCEKTRWHLELKGIDFTCHNMIPGLHAIPAWLIAQQTSLPILADDKVTLGDSTKIALYLEKNYPQSPLLPNDAVQQKQILEREDWFDTLGDHVRRYGWSCMIDRTDIVNIFFNFEGYSQFQHFLTRHTQPILRFMVRRTCNIYPEQVAISQRYVDDALLQIEKWLDGDPKNYLVGNTFTLADLTAASMLAPLIRPNLSPWSNNHLPDEIHPLQEQIQNSIVTEWVLRIYSQYR